MRNRLGLAAAGIAFWALPVAANGADDDPVNEDGDSLETVTVVGSRTARDAADVAATITVIDTARIERELARNIADLVRFEPGVSVGGTGSRFGLTGFNIRGMDGNRVLTVIDGVRVPEEFSFGPFLSSRRDFVDIDSLSRAEIARGPISALWGSDAIGGVVAFTTLQPHQYVTQDRRVNAGVKAGYTSADEGANAAITFAAGGAWRPRWSGTPAGTQASRRTRAPWVASVQCARAPTRSRWLRATRRRR